MPRMVEKLTEKEEEIEKELRNRFTEEQMCVFFLAKTIRSQYQFDDEFVLSWYNEIFEKEPKNKSDVRRYLVKAYTEMLMFEKKYKFHLDYWLRQYQDRLITEMESFFGGEPGK